jgi:hypothetical protein
MSVTSLPKNKKAKDFPSPTVTNTVYVECSSPLVTEKPTTSDVGLRPSDLTLRYIFRRFQRQNKKCPDIILSGSEALIITLVGRRPYAIKFIPFGE